MSPEVYFTVTLIVRMAVTQFVARTVKTPQAASASFMPSGSAT